MERVMPGNGLRAIRAAGMIVMLLGLGGCATQPGMEPVSEENRYQQHVEQAQAHWNHSEYEQAIAAYEKALAVRDTPEVRIALARLALATDHFTRAQRYFEKLLQDSPDNVDIREGLAIALLKQGKIAEAEQQFTAINNRAGGRPQTLNYLGVISDLRGDFEQAGLYYRQALNAQPDNTVFMNNYGYSQLMMKNYAEAEQWFRRALSHDAEDSARIVNNLSITYARQRHYEKAIEVLSSTGDDPVVLNNIGYIAILNGDYSQAVAYLEQAMELSPHYYARAAANLNRARAQLEKKAE